MSRSTNILKMIEDAGPARDAAEEIYKSDDCQALITAACKRHPGYNDPGSVSHHSVLHAVDDEYLDEPSAVRHELRSMVSGGIS